MRKTTAHVLWAASRLLDNSLSEVDAINRVRVSIWRTAYRIDRCPTCCNSSN